MIKYWKVTGSDQNNNEKTVIVTAKSIQFATQYGLNKLKKKYDINTYITIINIKEV